MCRASLKILLGEFSTWCFLLVKFPLYWQMFKYIGENPILSSSVQSIRREIGAPSLYLRKKIPFIWPKTCDTSHRSGEIQWNTGEFPHFTGVFSKILAKWTKILTKISFYRRTPISYPSLKVPPARLKNAVHSQSLDFFGADRQKGALVKGIIFHISGNIYLQNVEGWICWKMVLRWSSLFWPSISFMFLFLRSGWF